jgi:hypothetical protein
MHAVVVDMKIGFVPGFESSVAESDQTQQELQEQKGAADRSTIKIQHFHGTSPASRNARIVHERRGKNSAVMIPRRRARCQTPFTVPDGFPLSTVRAEYPYSITRIANRRITIFWILRSGPARMMA